MASTLSDLLLAIRALKRSPAFATAVVLTLAVGLGVNTAVFSVVNGAILRPLPVPDSDQLTVIARHQRDNSALAGVSSPDLEPYRALYDRVFVDIAGYTVGFQTLSVPGSKPAWVLTTYVTGNYFSTLGIKAAAGRLIRGEEVRAGQRSPIAVLGYNTWQRRFGSDPGVVGLTVTTHGHAVTIVGVAPEGFTGTQSFADSELYLPLTWREASPELFVQHTFARLRPERSIAEGQAVLDVLAARLAHDEPDQYANVRFSVVPEPLARPLEDLSRWNRMAATMVLGLAGLVLAVVTMNVMNLVLVRGTDRRRELAVRAALGASQGRLVRLLLTEAGLLAFVGGVVGLVLGTLTAYGLASIRLPDNLPARLDFGLDAGVLLYGVVLAGLALLVVGLVPAFEASRTALADAMREGDPRSAGAGRLRRFRACSIVAQVVVCFVLLMSAGLFARSLGQLERADVGFDPRGLINLGISATQLNLDEAGTDDLFHRIEQRVENLPDVRDVSFASTVPLGYIRLGDTAEVEGQPSTPAERLMTGLNVVSSSYFTTLGIPVVVGRTFTEADNAQSVSVAIVNRRFADVMWSNANAVGRRFRLSESGADWLQVVGVTPTGRYHAIAENDMPFVYLPLSQHHQPFRFLHVRAASSAETLLPRVVQAVRDIEPDITPTSVMTMEESLGGGFGLFLPRFIARFAAVFAMLALFLAGSGLYGLISYAVGRRVREIGIRVALGATPVRVLRLVMREGLRLVVLGLAIGLIAALLGARSLAGFLVGVSTQDPLTLTAVAAVLASVSLAACALPALRAIRIEPVDALREE